MTSFPLRLPDDLKEAAAMQAEASGVSLNQYLTAAIAARVGGHAAAERYFRARAQKVIPGRAKEILARAGTSPPRKGDEIEEASR